MKWQTLMQLQCLHLTLIWLIPQAVFALRTCLTSLRVTFARRRQQGTGVGEWESHLGNARPSTRGNYCDIYVLERAARSLVEPTSSFAGHLLLLHVSNANSCRDSRLAKQTHTHRHTPLMSKYLQLVTGQSLQLLDKQSTRSGHFMYRVRVAKQVTHTHTQALTHTRTHTYVCGTSTQ